MATNGLDRAFDPAATSATLLLDLAGSRSAARELAWRQFYDRYVPILTGFALKLGARASDIDEVVQDVMTGFYAASPTFVYDRSKGRFRGYLKQCVLSVLIKRSKAASKFSGLPLDQVGDIPEVQAAWDREWEQHVLRQALDEVRVDYHDNDTFRMFEQNVLLGRPAAEVATEFCTQAQNVHKAKERITRALRAKVQARTAEEG